jgi:lipopolysaccharide export system permease protein
MKHLDRYILCEMVWPFVGGLVTFVVLITGHMLFLAIEAIVDHHVPFSGVLRYIAYQVPGAAVMALPVASLLASALALNRLAADHEIAPLRAGGVSLARMTFPALLLGLGAAAAALWLHADLAPRAKQAAEGLLRDIVLRQKTLAFKPQRFVDSGRGLHFYAETVDNARETVGNLYAFLVRENSPPLLYWADSARFTDTTLEASRSRAYLLSTGGNLTDLEAEGLTIDLTQVQPSARYPSARMQAETLGELRRKLADSVAAGQEPDRQTVLELHCRLAMAGACLVFALLAGPVALRFGRGQSLVGVLITILVVFVYYVIMLWLRMLGNAGYLPPLVAAHGQNALLTLAATVAIWRQR